MTTTSEGEYFDRLVGETGEFNPFEDRAWDALAARFASVTNGTGPLQVLDIGCGTGASKRIYAARASVYVGVDLSLGALRAARARHRDNAWLQADGTRLPFRDGSFDVAALSSVLHHVPDMTAMLSAARRAVRPGGLVFAFDPNVFHPAMALFRHPSSPAYCAEGVSPHEQPLRPKVLRTAFPNAGLTAVGQRCQSDLPYRAVAPKGFHQWLRAYNTADWVWEHIGAGRWFGAFVITWGRRPEEGSRSTFTMEEMRHAPMSSCGDSRLD
jgi:ubiquinone/menaquinone biosynthesis C-methylase UbiE